jgi:CheY-like chemotaxis protein
MEQGDGYKYILIADDDPSIILLVRTIVEKEGFVALIANDGKEAYKILSSGKRIDGVIVDLRMPYIEGNEIIKFMQSDEKLASIPVVIMTGETSPKITSKFSTSGAMGFLPKPFSAIQLRTVLGMLKKSA